MKNFIYKLSSILLIFPAVYFFAGCGDKPLFDELAENRVTVRIKGTYESNDPRAWQYPGPDDYDDDNSVYVYPNAADDEAPTLFMLDIAGMKISSGKHDQYFANYRETYSAGFNNSDPFFSGKGFKYENDDMRPDFRWKTIKMYIRKMIFNNAKIYDVSGLNNVEFSPNQFEWRNTWDYDREVEVIFHEEDVYGLNFNLFQTITYCDYIKEDYDEINRIFPLRIRVEDDFVLDYDEEEIVLEIRLVIKNFIKKYEYEYDTSKDVRKLVHFYALSDWLRDIHRNEAVNGVMGGNLLAVARSYVPGKTASIAGTATANRHVVAIKSNHDISEYIFSGAERTRPARPFYGEPKPPRAPVMPPSPDTQDEHDYIEALLDYYLQREKYKYEYDNDFIPNVDNGDYATQWDIYNDRLNDFKIPPIVTFSATDGSYILKNVPVGETYRIYESDAAVPAGELPGNFTYLGTATLTEDDIGTTVSP